MIERSGNMWSVWSVPKASGYLMPAAKVIKSGTTVWTATNSIPLKSEDEAKNIILCTTNSIKRKDGTLVMGAGTAKTAAQKIPDLPKLIGNSIVAKEDYHIRIFMEHSVGCIQTKRFWGDPSPIDLVENSLVRLCIIATAMPDLNFHLPRPGCGLGGLKWEDVKKLAEILPDNCFVWNIEDDKGK